MVALPRVISRVPFPCPWNVSEHGGLFRKVVEHNLSRLHAYLVKGG